jgi:hypothetical protein
VKFNPYTTPENSEGKGDVKEPFKKRPQLYNGRGFLLLKGYLEKADETRSIKIVCSLLLIF